MMRLEDLPRIEGGSPKQKIFAEGVRLNFIEFAETELSPNLYQDVIIVLQVRVTYKWWINQAKKIDEKSIKTMISAAKASVSRAGSVEAAVQVQKDALKRQMEKYLEYLEYRHSKLYDEVIDDDISIDGERERPF